MCISTAGLKIDSERKCLFEARLLGSPAKEKKKFAKYGLLFQSEEGRHLKEFCSSYKGKGNIVQSPTSKKISYRSSLV